MIDTKVEYHTELIDGQEIQKFAPKALHAEVQLYLLLTLNPQLRGLRGWKALPELNLICGKERLVPDVTLISPSSKFRDGDLLSPAILTFEIMSPGQTLPQLFDRARRIVHAGTLVCIVIWPESRRVWAYSNEGAVEQADVIRSPVPECDFDVAAMWRSIDAHE